MLLVVALAVFAFQAIRATQALKQARGDAAALATDFSTGDLDKAQRDSRLLQRHVSAAHSYASGPLWWVGAKVPWLGANVSAVQDTADGLDVIARSTMPVLLQLSSEYEHGSLRPRDGRIDPAAIRSLAPSVRRAADELGPVADRIARIKTGSLIGPLASAMRQVQDRVHQADVAISVAANAFDVLPTMLGIDGPRQYLLIVQNPAEIRAAGGLAGTWAILRADDGRLNMVHASDSGGYTPTTQAVKPTPQEAALFGSNWGLSANDTTQTPDFPRGAHMAAVIAAQHGSAVSAVFSVDPIALAGVLKGTGSVKVTPQVTLTAANAVDILLNRVYLTMDPVQQNAFYALAAGKIFDALVAGQGNRLQAIRGLVDGVNDHRVFAWSSEKDIARVISSSGLSGQFPTNTGKTPQVGLYLNDGAPGKQEYYLTQRASARATACQGGVQTISLSATFSSHMPRSAAALPPSVVGTGEFSPKGTMLMTMYVAAPWKGSVDSLVVDGKPVTVTAGELDGRQLATFPLSIRPGASISVTATMRTGSGQTEDGRLTSTPGMVTGTNPVSFASAC